MRAKECLDAVKELSIKYEADLRYNSEIIKIEQVNNSDSYYVLTTSEGEAYNAKQVIVA